MSDTPRTDAVIFRATFAREAVESDFARQLERELAEAREDAMDHKRMLQSLSKTQALDRAELDRSFQYVIKQRDTLAEALKLCEKHLEKHGHEKCDEELDETGWWLLCDVRTALAAVKGGCDD